ncbi:MAG: DUF4129 domain-containing protein [Planctomycetes bacterium]|nr:DUF4129 domain-containing protein [Planctomycetota bacterium]
MARLRKTLTDYVVIAISPALIIMLIGSLVLFLLEVFYQGPYLGRLQWIFSLFVFAAVLIGRISIEEGREYALFFAAPLGLVTLLAVFKFVEFSGPLAGFSTVLNIALIALIWWCADRLTWDCTVIDEREDASGEGLLQTVGMDGTSGRQSADDGAQAENLEATSSRESGPSRLWGKFIEHRRRPHSPGVWVVYFSLAALPLFGIGHRFIPEANTDSRRYAFWLLSMYVASGLGLLMTTSFLGLRRYLRQRRLEMPIEMAGVWLGVGCVMIVALLLACNILPRPSAEYAITDVSFGVSSPDDLEANRYAMGNDGAEDEQQQSQSTTVRDQEGDGEASGKSAKRKGGKKGSKGSGGQSKSKDGSQGSGENDGEGKNGEGKKSEGSGKQDSGESGSKSKQGNRKDSGESSGEGSGEKDGERSSENEGEEGNEDEATSQDRKNRAGTGDADTEEQERERKQNGRSSGSRSDSSSFKPSQMMSKVTGGISSLLKALYYLVFLAIVGYFVWRYRTQVLAAITGFIQAIREFLERLFGGRQAEQESEESLAAALAPPPRSFAEFTDPFATGTAASFAPHELVAYTFEAVEAWAREHGCARDAEQTPHEFARRVATSVTSVGVEAQTLANLYCAAAYSEETLSRTSVQRLERLWHALRTNASQEPVVV